MQDAPNLQVPKLTHDTHLHTRMSCMHSTFLSSDLEHLETAHHQPEPSNKIHGSDHASLHHSWLAMEWQLGEPLLYHLAWLRRLADGGSDTVRPK